jgi:hypothetical protein
MMEGKKWPTATSEELGTSWRSLDYSQENSEERLLDVTYFGDDNKFSLTSLHGAPCPNGYTYIRTPRQCMEAGEALRTPRPGVIVRKPSLRMLFRGKTWYLVRHTPGSHWHNSTDDLLGTDVYGEYPDRFGELDTSPSFSIPFGNKWTEMLFSSGFSDGELSTWGIVENNTKCFGPNVSRYYDIYEGGNSYYETMHTSHNDGAKSYLLDCNTVLHRGESHTQKSHPIVQILPASSTSSCGWQKLWQIISPDITSTGHCGGMTPEDAVSIVRGHVLYMESADNSIEPQYMPVPPTGANVWIDHDPNDGFMLNRTRQVPGCSLDSALLSNVTRMQDAALYWEENNSHNTRQFGDNAVNFNSVYMEHLDTDPSIDFTLWKSGVSWLRGEPICVKNNEIDEMYHVYNSSGTRFMWVSEPGVACPERLGYKAIENFQQCSAAASDNNFVDPREFYNWVENKTVELTEFIPGCLIIPKVESNDEESTGNDGDDPFGTHDYFKIESFDSSHFTLNPDPSRHAQDPKNFRGTDSEGLRPYGYAVCVHEGDWVEPFLNTTLFVKKANEESNVAFNEVVDRDSKYYWSGARFTLLMQCDVTVEGANCEDGAKWSQLQAMSDSDVATFTSLLTSTVSRVTGLPTESISIDYESLVFLDANDASNLNSVQTRRSSVLSGILVNVHIVSPYHQHSSVVENMENSFQTTVSSSQNTGTIDFNSLIVNLATIEESLALFENVGFEASLVMADNAVLPPDHPSANTMVSDFATPITQTLRVSTRVDTLTPPDPLSPTNQNRLWWESVCSCDTPTGECAPSEDLSSFEIRSSNLGELSESTIMVAPQVQNHQSLKNCISFCKQSAECVVMVFTEVAAPGVQGSERCRYYKDFDTLPGIAVNNSGGFRLRIKLNSCPSIHLKDVHACHTASNNEGECTTLSRSGNSDPFDIETSRLASATFLPSVDTQDAADYTTDTFVLNTMDNYDTAQSKCWSHNNTEYFNDTLCYSGRYVPLQQAEFVIYQTDDCVVPESSANQDVNFRDMSGSTMRSQVDSRMLCPPSHPYMCRERHVYSRDYLCVDEVSKCEPLGGLRPCSWIGYDMSSIPTLEEVAFNIFNVTTTSFYEHNVDTEIYIDSVSRCGGEFVTQRNRTHVVFTNTTGMTCPTGFACCETNQPQPKPMCPETHPYRYRPNHGYDYCCANTSPLGGSGVPRSESCMEDAFTPCRNPEGGHVAGCLDYNSDEDHARAVTMQEVCECPEVADSDHLQIEGGVFAGSCHYPMSRWPNCVHECVEMGQDCQYYLLHKNQNNCLLCYATIGLVNTSDWSYHITQTPVVKDSKNEMHHYTKQIYSSFHAGGYSTYMGDATLRVEGDWYALQLCRVDTSITGILSDVCSQAQTCPNDYHPLSSLSQSQGITNSKVLLAHCMRAALAYDDYNKQRCQVAKGNNASACTFHVCNGTECDGLNYGCNAVFKNYNDAYNVVQWYPPIFVFSHSPPTGTSNFTVKSVCRQDGGEAVQAPSETWESCSDRCSRNPECTHWSWDTDTVSSKGKRCAIFDMNTNSQSALQGSRMRVDVKNVFTAPFGYNWVAGKRSSDPKEIWEANLNIRHARIYRTALTGGALERVNFDSFKNAITHLNDVDIKAILDSVSTPTLEYYSMFMTSTSNNDMSVQEAERLQSISPDISWFSHPSREIWKISPHVHRVDDPRRRLVVDTDCWHSRMHADGEYTPGQTYGENIGALVADQRVLYKNRLVVSTDTNIHLWIDSQEYMMTLSDQLLVACWVYVKNVAHAASPSGKFVPLIGAPSKIQNPGSFLVLYNVDTSFLSLCWNKCNDGDCVYTLIHLLFQVPSSNWNHISFLLNNTQPGTSSISMFVNNRQTLRFDDLVSDKTESQIDDWLIANVLQSSPHVRVDIHDMVLDKNLYDASTIGPRVSKLMQLQPDVCSHSIEINTQNGTATLSNPLYGVRESLVKENINSDMMLADSSLPMASTFDWQRLDCGPQFMQVGYEYTFEAVFEEKLTSLDGFYTSIVNSSFVPWWLTLCNSSFASNTKEPCIKESKAKLPSITWEVIDSHTNDDSEQTYLIRNTETSQTIWMQLELDLQSTFPEVYNIHVSNQPPLGFSTTIAPEHNMPILDWAKGVTISLADDSSFLLSNIGKIYCYGVCPFSPNPAGISNWYSDPFTLTRGGNSISIGAIKDNNNPTGIAQTTPAIFANGTETHRLSNSGCSAWPHAYRIISMQTERCMTKDISAHNSFGFVYRPCYNANPADVCWSIVRSVAEVSTPGHTVYEQHTLLFDDTKLWPHSNVIAPIRSKRTDFLNINTTTDVFFSLQLSPSQNDMGSGIVITPMRMYMQNETGEHPVAFFDCIARVQDLSHVRSRCLTPCNGTYNQGVCETVFGTGDCLPACYPQGAEWPTGVSTQFELEVTKMTIGVSIKKRPWTLEDREGPGACLASHQNPDDPDTLQLSPCSTNQVDYFVLDEVSGDGSSRVRSMTYDKCIGTHGDILKLVGCDSANVILRNTMVDDASFSSKTNLPANPNDAEAVGAYSDDTKSITMVYYRRPSGGTMRIVVDYGAPHLHATLIHTTLGLPKLPSQHSYMARVERTETTPGVENQTYSLFFNGTLVFYQTRQVGIHVDNQAHSDAAGKRVTVPSSIATPLQGAVRNIDFRAYRHNAPNTISSSLGYSPMDESVLRFGTGTRWRLFKSNATVYMANESASSCAKECRDRHQASLVDGGGGCAAARWSEHTRNCEILSKCDTYQAVAEGQPNTFNRKESPWFLYNRTNEDVIGKHPLIPVQLHSTHSQETKSMMVEKLVFNKFANESTISFRYIPSSDLFPDGANVLTTQQPPPHMDRRFGRRSGADIMPPTPAPVISPTSPEAKANWQSNWYSYVEDVQLPFTMDPSISTSISVTQPSPTPHDALTPPLYAKAGFPLLKGHINDTYTEIVCESTETFAFAGVLKSREARFGYRKIMSPASEGGEGGANLLLSPDGHLKDKSSDISIETYGQSGCMSVVVIDCSNGYKVSVNGQLKYTTNSCPFDLKATNTLLHGWTGRVEAMCFGGGLTRDQHIELVAYFQLHHNTSHCWDIGASHNKHTVNSRVHALPHTQPHPTMLHPQQHTWRMSNLDFEGGTDPTWLRCTDPIYCSNPESNFEIYKLPLNNQSNPFGLIARVHPSQLPGGCTGGAITCIAVAVVPDGEAKLQWKEIYSIQDAIDLGSSLMHFSSSVSLDKERKACEIDVVATGKNIKEAPDCSCPPSNNKGDDDKGFTRWEPFDNNACDAYQCSDHTWYNESDVVSDTCGECEVLREMWTHPRFNPSMNFWRKTGRRLGTPGSPEEGAQRIVISMKRQRIPDSGGCAGFDANPESYTLRNYSIKCKPCPRDCTFHEMTRNSVMQTTSPKQCESILENNGECRQKSYAATNCVVERVINLGPSDEVPGLQEGGRSCRQVTIDDLMEVSKHDHLQPIISQNQSEASTRAIYNPDISSYILGDTMCDHFQGGASTTCIKFTMWQGAVYQAEGWDWVSRHMWSTLKESAYTCEQPCPARDCVDLGPPQIIMHTIEENSLNLENILFWAATLVGIILIPIASCAFVRYGCLDYGLGLSDSAFRSNSNHGNSEYKPIKLKY